MRDPGAGPAEAQSSSAAAAFGVDFSANGTSYYLQMTESATAAELHCQFCQR